jgi:hypothetical protein
MAEIYEVLRWDGLSFHDVRTKFRKDWFRNSEADAQQQQGEYTYSHTDWRKGFMKYAVEMPWYTRAIRKVNSEELLTKQAMGKKLVYYTKKNTYILKLLLNVVTAGI